MYLHGTLDVLVTPNASLENLWWKWDVSVQLTDYGILCLSNLSSEMPDYTWSSLSYYSISYGGIFAACLTMSVICSVTSCFRYSIV